MGIQQGSKITTIEITRDHEIAHFAQILSDQEGVPVGRMNLVFNGKAFYRYGKIPEEYKNHHPSALGIMKGSVVICILSSGVPEAEKTEEQRANDNIGMEEADKQDHQIVLTCQFKKRPFGFAVWANAQGKNAIVTKVAGSNALSLGIQIGYVVYICNKERVYGRPHDEVLELLKTTPCPLVLQFADLGEEYTCAFTSKPLGFTVIQDREENNAKVSKINTRAAQNLGVLIGSYVVGVNMEKVFGMKHKAIIGSINRAQFPINIIFRHPPPLLMLAPRARRNKNKARRR